MSIKKKSNKTTKFSSSHGVKNFIIIFVCLLINGLIIYYVSGMFISVYKKQQEKDQLTERLNSLKDKEEQLKVEVTKLSDSDYVAKYAREKYLYSGEGEYIIRIK